jgi:hypothetical protein
LWRQLGDLPPGWTLADLEHWVRQYFHYLDESGAFLTVWRQAAASDAGIQDMGRRTRHSNYRKAGQALDRLRGYPVGSPTYQGLILHALLTETWHSMTLSDESLHERDVVANLVRVLYALLMVPAEMERLAGP